MLREVTTPNPGPLPFSLELDEEVVQLTFEWDSIR
jgi:hypothetical protein